MKIGFIGLGNMGAPMAKNLANAGHEVSGFDVTAPMPDGVSGAESGAEAARDADVVITMLPDGAILRRVADEVIPAMKPGAVLLDCSTVDVESARAVADQAEAAGLGALDAPVSGGDIGAQQGTLTIMVGGSQSDFEECKPLFEAMGNNITLCGDIGSGQGVKMCNQILCSLYMVGLCEAMQLAQQQGIDPNLIVEVCSTGAAGSWALSNLGGKIIEGDYAPGFAIKHIVKDLRLVRETADTLKVNLPGTELADRQFKKVREMDGGRVKEQGTQAMIRAYKQ